MNYNKNKSEQNTVSYLKYCIYEIFFYNNIIIYHYGYQT